MKPSNYLIYLSILMIMIMLIPQASHVTGTPQQASHPVPLFMYTETGNDILSPVEPTQSSETVKPCPNQTQQNTWQEISVWDIDLVGDIVMDGESINFYVDVRNGQGSIGEQTTDNDISIRMQFMRGTTILATEIDENITVGTDAERFRMTISDFSFGMDSGDSLAIRLWYSWTDSDGNLPFAPPDDLELVYASRSLDAHLDIPLDYVWFSNQNRNVRDDDKEVDLSIRANDAFGIDDLEDFTVNSIFIEKDDQSFSADQEMIVFNGQNPSGNNILASWTWDYGNDEATHGDYTATVEATDVRDHDWTTEITFVIPEEVEPEYGVVLSSTKARLTGAPDATLSFNVKLENVGTVQDSFNIILMDENDHSDWATGFTPGKVVNNVDDGGSFTFKFSCTVPNSGISDGHVQEFDIKAVSQEDSGASDTIRLSAEVEITRDAYVSVLESKLDTSLTHEALFKITVRNDGNMEDTFQLSASDTQGWTLRFTSGGNIVTLDPDQETTVRLSVTPDDYVKNSEVSTITIVVISLDGDGVYITLDLTAEVVFELNSVMDDLVEVKQDESGEIDITITSKSESDERVVLSAKIDNSSTNWVTFFDDAGNEIPTIFILNSGDTVDIIAKVKIPDDADEGSYTITILGKNTDGKRLSPFYTVALIVKEKDESDTDMTMLAIGGGTLLVIIAAGGLVVMKRRKRDDENEDEDEEDDEIDDDGEDDEDEARDQKESKVKAGPGKPVTKPIPPKPPRQAHPKIAPRPGPGRSGHPPPPPQQPYPPPYRPPPPHGQPPIQARPLPVAPQGPYPPQPIQVFPDEVVPVTIQSGPEPVVIAEEPPMVVGYDPYQPAPGPAVVIAGEPQVQAVEEEPKKGRFSRKKKKDKAEKKGKSEKKSEKKKGRFSRKKKGSDDTDAAVVNAEPVVVDDGYGVEPVALVDEEPPAVVEEEYEAEVEAEYGEEEEYEAEVEAEYGEEAEVEEEYDEDYSDNYEEEYDEAYEEEYEVVEE